MLADFMDYLGQKDKRFRNIAYSALNTSHKGTYQIYDPLRKRVQRLEEKNMPRSVKASKEKPVPKTSCTRGDAAKAKNPTPDLPVPEPNQIREKPEPTSRVPPAGKTAPADCVQITAKDHLNYH